MLQPSNRHGPRRWRAEYDRLRYRLAFPACREDWEQAAASLPVLHHFIGQKLEAGNSSYGTAFAGTGIPGSVICTSFSFALTCWLVRNFPGDIHIDSCVADPETIRIFFRALLPRTEFEHISAGEWSLQKRIRLLKGDRSVSDLCWLVELLSASRLPERVTEYLYHSLQVVTRWHTRHSPEQPVFLQQKVSFYPAKQKKPVRISLTSKKPLPRPLVLDTEEKIRLIGLTRYTLALLYRETEPFTYADPAAVTCFRMENGLVVVLFGMEPERRLSIESYIGYLALVNGFPVAYGGGWVFGRRCQFGINILPAYRGSSSAAIFAQVLRVYHQYYGITQLYIKPYQFGKNNPEAIRSGAFWFYYKLGFRPVDPRTRQLAREEKEKIKALTHYRCPPSVLKQLAGAGLWFYWGQKEAPLPDAASLSAAISGMIGERYRGDREYAIRECRSRMDTLLGHRIGAIPAKEKKVFDEWSLLAAAVLDTGNWKPSDRAAFRKLIQVKVHADERVFIRQLQKTGRFWKDIAGLPVTT